ncbi:MAG: peptidase U32 family protein, partial [Selenomonadaceae bacterium]
MVELLAPAGSREALLAAIEAGANAVYLAGTMFGARAYADNFDEEGLREAIRLAHLRNVLINVTVNTIVDDQELPKLKEYLKFLYDAGADAVLVQDMGVARVAHEVAPGLPLHASTQMTVHNLDGVRALEKLGFSRVVLSRELSLEAIRHICANAKAEIEVFVHGALCVCYSGQCLMSSIIGGRSGNRGRCAQPCRLPYALIDEKGNDLLGDAAGRYLLSPRDINAIELLPQLIDAGVASLKIEGRMKRPEYVAIVVDSYRRAIDSYYAGRFEVEAKTSSRLAQIFNRDFTTAFMEKKQGRNMMSDKRPNNRGLMLGRVLFFDKESHRAILKLSAPLAEGDQVDFWVKVGGRVTANVKDMKLVMLPADSGKKGKSGMSINALKKAASYGQAAADAEAGMMVSLPVDSMVFEHDRVFKVYDNRLMSWAGGFFKAGAPVRRIPLKVRVSAAVGEPFR